MSRFRLRRLIRFSPAVLVCLAMLVATAPVWAAAGQIHEFPTLTPSSQPTALVLGPDHNVWFSEVAGGNIGRITKKGKVTEFLVGNVQPSGIAVGADGNLWFTENTGNAIGVMNLSGQVIATYPIPTPTSGANHIHLDRATGLLWFTEAHAGKIASISTSGSITEYVLPLANAGPIDLAVGAKNTIYYIDPNNNVVGKLTAGNGKIKTFTITTPGNGPNRIVKGPGNNLYFTEAYTNQIGVMTPLGTFAESLIPTSSSVPEGSSPGPDGNLWFCELAGNQIGRMTPNGSFLGEFLLPTPSAGCDNVVAGPGGSTAPMYFSEVFASQIGTITTQ